eukprot:1708876-Prymnesium_polylepis.1
MCANANALGRSGTSGRGRYERSEGSAGRSGDRAEIAISGDGVLHVLRSTDSLTFVEFPPKYTIRMV